MKKSILSVLAIALAFAFTGCKDDLVAPEITLPEDATAPVFQLGDTQSALEGVTANDAKDGDVLAGSYGTFILMGKSNGGYCGVLNDNTFIKSTGNNEWTKDLHPATKEQRDLLFQKMNEASYEWDAEKKELRRIEQNPAWSEEDERMFQSVMIDCSYCGDFPDYPTREEQELYDEAMDKINWLKSLKERMKV